MDLKKWKEKGTFFTYKSHQIFTIDEGEGEVILLIHGFPMLPGTGGRYGRN